MNNSYIGCPEAPREPEPVELNLQKMEEEIRAMSERIRAMLDKLSDHLFGVTNCPTKCEEEPVVDSVAKGLEMSMGELSLSITSLIEIMRKSGI